MNTKNFIPFKKTYHSRIYFSNKNKTHVVKRTFPDISAETEFLTIQFLKENGFDFIPHSILERTENQTFLIQDFIESPKKTLNKIKKSEIHTLGSALSQLHQIQQSHKTELSVFCQNYFDLINKTMEDLKFHRDTIIQKGLINQFKMVQRLAALCEAAYRKKSEFKKTLNLSFLHGDLDSGHFLFRDNRLYIVDWELSLFGNPVFDPEKRFYYQFGDPACDLAKLFYDQLFPFSKFWKFYTSVQEDKRDILKRIPLYHLMHLIQSIAFNIQHCVISSEHYIYLQNDKDIKYRRIISHQLNQVKEVLKQSKQ